MNHDRHILCIAYHFPPIQGSTGVHRTLGFARYLAEYDWNVTVLTANAKAYPGVSLENRHLIPDTTKVEHAFALDAARHIAIRGRYPLLLALPDRWQSWILGGVFKGLRLIRRERPNIIWSTYPIASAHVIGWLLSSITRIPWIADFRDPMVQENYPSSRMVRGSYAWIERRVVGGASFIVVTTRGAAQKFIDRYGADLERKIKVIENGFDPAVVAGECNLTKSSVSRSGEPKVFLHSGLLYPDERDPTALFGAIAELKAEGQLDESKVNVLFRGCGFEEKFQAVVKELRIDKIVKFLPPISYKKAVEEMMRADFLLLLQARNCNSQIPAKIYEYFYVNKPIVALTDWAGDTADLLQRMQIDSIADIRDKGAIKRLLMKCLETSSKVGMVPHSRRGVDEQSRRSRTKQLVALLDQLT